VRETRPLFAWQSGYGAFSVRPSQLERVRKYVTNQAEHHRRRSFEDEFIAMLTAAEIVFDPSQVFG
jgi:hypothetical protein